MWWKILVAVIGTLILVLSGCYMKCDLKNTRFLMFRAPKLIKAIKIVKLAHKNTISYL